MRIQSLTIEHLRLFDHVQLEPAAGINLITGANGAGKTTVLEAIHLLSAGRSFRGSVRDALIRQGQPELRVFSSLLSEADERPVRLGLSRSLRGWSARLDGEPVELLSRLFHELAVICFEPGSHALISGGSENRRRFIDWALFHVEHAFLPVWRRYQRALKQRNALLKQSGNHAAALDSWDQELARQGAELTRLRQDWFESFRPLLEESVRLFLPELGEMRLKYLPGWSGDYTEAGLAASLASARSRDLVMGHTTTGPHRADWSVGFEHAPSRGMFSRGQEKLVVLAALLAQAQGFSRARDQWPVLLLDDLASELDAQHLAQTLHYLAGISAQTFITGTAVIELPAQPVRPVGMFHVEHGVISPLL